MEALLGKVTQQAVNYAIKSGVTLTATFALRQGTRLIRSSPKSDSRDEVARLQQKLDHKIRIIGPAIDMIELISARGNTSLESAVTLTKDLRYEIQSIAQRLEQAAATSEQHKLRGSNVSLATKQKHELELQHVAADMRQLLARIEDAVPLINLAITTSGATLSTQLPSTISPSRLLQASTLLTAGDTQYSVSPNHAVQVGPTFVLSVYMLFAGYDRPQNEEEIRETMWKEVIHKAKVKIRRVPLDIVISTGTGSDAIPSIEIASRGSHSHAKEDSRIPAESRADEYAYQLMIVEDFDDDRVHDFNENEPQPTAFDDISRAGVREMIPIHEISKIFYADTSKVLNISPESEAHHPVLLLKRDLNAIPPRRMVESDGATTGIYDENEQEEASKQYHTAAEHIEDRNDDPWRLPPSLDPEWIAFEVYTEADTSETESEGEAAEETTNSVSTLAASLSNVDLKSASPKSTSPSALELRSSSSNVLSTAPPPPWANRIQTSLSLLELLLRLTSLQQFQQASHLSITDELLNFFLEESATTGAGGDENHRQAVRAEARRRVGWDPYDESPLKRRGEEYQYQYQYPTSEQQDFSPRDGNSYARYSREGTPIRGSTPGQTGYMDHRSGRGSGAQTRSTTGIPSDGGYSPSPATKTRTDFIRRQGQSAAEKQGSPLRQLQRREVSSPGDEGLGTSPASAGTDARRSS